ncbi:hypothetical protein DNK34_07675 [Pseudomonas dryadis]|uniref:Uncharacterized protein n=1 Tax=Phytopseudomonas dryadis TaxID=2487520 RepID=A0ABY1Z901_9GAMM|nr:MULTISPECIES: hypothetical protein [Pseudomonas]TBV07584.1 hypothetical protein DNK34_07675 [Pseudomonas dryadis]TBV19990.1 hypothetical protein DNK41_00675 [Pseudomonas sp. FRB 230]
MSSPSSNRLKASLFIFVGAVLLIIAAFQGVSRLQFIKIASTTEGRVSALNAGGSHPQIDFIDQRGEAISYAQGGSYSAIAQGFRSRFSICATTRPTPPW